MSQELLGTSNNGEEVWYNPAASHAATHFASNPNLRQHVVSAIKGLALTDDNIYEEIQFSQPLGMMDLVATDETDEIVYAKRLGRDIYTRFTKSRPQSPASAITLWLVKSEGGYELKSAWFGHKTPPFPGDEWETAESKPFWESHALVWGSQAIQEGTVTTECPW